MRAIDSWQKTDSIYINSVWKNELCLNYIIEKEWNSFRFFVKKRRNSDPYLTSLFKRSSSSCCIQHIFFWPNKNMESNFRVGRFCALPRHPLAQGTSPKHCGGLGSNATCLPATTRLSLGGRGGPAGTAGTFRFSRF